MGRLPEHFSLLHDYLIQAPHPLIVGGVLAFLFVLFVLHFFLRALWRLFKLWLLQSKLRGLPKNIGPQALLDEIEKIFKRDKRITHLWTQYRETLHVQYKESGGEPHIKAIRATVPAELYFSGQTLVESWLHTDFYKHLPGIFTGLGIIGTFFGLISGLDAFEISENPGIARDSLASLMHAVSHAFYVSATAITAAMLVTFLEKALVAVLLNQAEAIARALDKHFAGGVDEEYLSRLVKASEQSATHAGQLKDALVNELRVMLENLTQSQIDSNQRRHDALVRELNKNSQEQADSISQGIAQSLAQPLDKIAATVEKASGEQGEAAVLMLQRVMERFGANLQKLLGGQIDGLQGLNNQAAQAMEKAVTSLNSLISKLETSGEDSTKAMATQMAAAVAGMKSELSGISSAMRQAVTGITEQVGVSQETTNRKLQETLEKIQTAQSGMNNQIAATMENVVASLNTLVEKLESSGQQTAERMADEMKNAVADMKTELSGISGAMQTAIGTITTKVGTLQEETDRKLQETLNKVDKTLHGLLETIRVWQSDTMKNVQDSHEATTRAAETAATNITGGVDKMLVKLDETMRGMEKSVGTFNGAVTDNIDKMNAGAKTLNDAASDFAKAGQSVSGVLDKSTMVSTNFSKASDDVLTSTQMLGEASSQFHQAAQSVTASLSDYQNQRNLIVQTLENLKSTILQAKQKASVTEDVLTRMENSAQMLAKAHVDIDEYLEKVSATLAQSNQAFTTAMTNANNAFKDSVTNTLKATNHDFHENLSQSVKLLNTAIQELEITITSAGVGHKQ